MADETIFELTGETAMTAASRLIVQKTGATTRATSATYALMGGLEENAQTPVSSDITGAVGQFYLITQSSQSADINLTLPASANDGERIGVHMVDGDDTYEVILKGAATVTINGGSAATEWSRLFIAGETVIFRCTSSTNWIVEYDGRIPSFVWLESTAGTTITEDGWTVLPTADTVTNNHGLKDGSYVTPRRSGNYICSVFSRAEEGTSGAYSENYSVNICTAPTGTPALFVSGNKGSDYALSFTNFAVTTVIRTLTAGTTYGVYVYLNVSSAAGTWAEKTNAGNRTTIAIRELL